MPIHGLLLNQKTKATILKTLDFSTSTHWEFGILQTFLESMRMLPKFFLFWKRTKFMKWFNFEMCNGLFRHAIFFYFYLPIIYNLCSVSIIEAASWPGQAFLLVEMINFDQWKVYFGRGRFLLWMLNRWMKKGESCVEVLYY